MVDTGGADLAPLASLPPATKNRELFDEGSHPNSDNRFGETCAFHASARVEIRWTFHQRDSFQFAESEAFLFFFFPNFAASSSAFSASQSFRGRYCTGCPRRGI